MAKDRRSPYVPGKRTDRWQKVKIRPEQELVVGGWVTGAGKAVDLGALLVGVYEDGALRYAGKIGAGFTNSNRAELLAAVAPLAAAETPFATPPPRAAARDAQWLRPELVIRAEFAGWTGDGLVRQAAYKGIELEKDPRRSSGSDPPADTLPTLPPMVARRETELMRFFKGKSSAGAPESIAAFWTWWASARDRVAAGIADGSVQRARRRDQPAGRRDR